MKSAEPEPLWREVVGDTEPWRRGRLILVLFAALTLISDIILLGDMMLKGNIEALLAFGVLAMLFWLQFYFIWIGVHWVRWLAASLCGLSGLFQLVWSLEDWSSLTLFSGAYAVVVAAYLGFSPSVYFFAQRQRETKQWATSLAVAAVSLLVVVSLGCGILGLLAYKAQLETGAREFGDLAFQRVFTNHDTYFLLDHATDDALKNNGRARLTGFLQDATIRAGNVRDIKPCTVAIRFSYAFPTTFVVEGQLATQGVGERGRIELLMRVDQITNDWRIDDIGWIYPDSVRLRR
jgi:hypothetical protein